MEKSIANLNFQIRELDYNKRNGNLNIKASSIVKSNKFFPTYIINNKNYIFKPLSKTKPLTTTMFSYAEVVWSYIFNTYFCNAPLYQLAICNGYEENEEKYYDYGCLVENILKENEHLVNLYEYFKENKDNNVEIDDYINYCMLFYDYTNILSSKIFKENKNLNDKLVMQILLSILSINQNFHYENIAFVCNDNNEILDLAPPIDHEFSNYFLFPEDKKEHTTHYLAFLKQFETKESIIVKNLDYIKKHHNHVVVDFLKKLEILKNDLISNKNGFIFYDFGFVQSGNSFSYMIGKSRYKENDETSAKIYETIFKPKPIDVKEVNQLFLKELLNVIQLLENYFKN